MLFVVNTEPVRFFLTLLVGYKEEPGVDATSMNDTYFAARLYIDNPSWSGIPFYIRTGKRMDTKSTKIVIEFKNNEKQTDTLPANEITPNLLIIEISPNEGISLMINMKNPSSDQFEPAYINFSANSEDQPEAYELLLFDAIRGNATFFANWKEVELSWHWIQPILEAFQENTLPLHVIPCRFKWARKQPINYCSPIHLSGGKEQKQKHLYRGAGA